MPSGAGGNSEHPFIVPVAAMPANCGIGTVANNLALRSIADAQSIAPYEKGCVLNFLEHTDAEGCMPIFVTPRKTALTAFGPGEKKYSQAMFGAACPIYLRAERGCRMAA